MRIKDKLALYFKSDYLSQKILARIGLSLFAFFGWLGVAGSSFGAGLLVVLALFQFPKVSRSISKQKIVWLSLIVILYLVIHWSLTVPIDKHMTVHALKYTKSLIYLWLFFIIGWHFRNHIEMHRWLLGMAVCGFIIQIFMETDWQHLSSFVEKRQEFGFSFTGAGLHCALSIWALIFVTLYLIRKFSGVSRWIVLLIASMSMIFLIEALILTESRSAWIAFAGCITTIVFLVVVKDSEVITMRSTRQLWFVGIFLIVTVGVLVGFNYEKLFNRITDESNVYSAFLSLDRQQIPYTSIGIRAHMMIYGVDLWLKKPIFGWGVGSSYSLLAQDEILKVGDHPHFHNNYLELLIEQGVVGLSFYIVAFTLLMRGLFRAYRDGSVPKDLFYYLIGSWIMVLIWSLADSRMVHADLRFVLLFLSGMTFSYMLLNDKSSNT